MRAGGSYRQRHSDAEFQALVQEARERHLLSDIVRRHTDLKKRGPRELVGLCPFHSERSPSFEVNDAKGTYHCHGCGKGGDAITFLMDREGMRFRDAVQTLHGDVFPVISEEERAHRKAQDARLEAERVALARSIWSRSVPLAGTPGEIYARSRGIEAILSPAVHFVMTPRWRDPETGEVGPDYPAVACALQDCSDAIVGVQCIFLSPDGTRKYERIRPDGTNAKAKLSFGIIVGSALRLGPCGPHVILCEGPEDGWTLAQANPECSVWVACGTAMLPQVQFPAEIECVTLAGDNGDAGHAAVDRARAIYLGAGLAVNSMFPGSEFKDWNDQLRGVRS